MTQLGFLVFYLVAMVPTYILPYFGSNSLLAALSTMGITLLFSVVHIACFVVMIWAAYLRGPVVGKRFLWAFPLAAMFFDLVPGLSLVPLVPTVMHAIALIVGGAGRDVVEADA